MIQKRCAKCGKIMTLPEDVPGKVICMGCELKVDYFTTMRRIVELRKLINL